MRGRLKGSLRFPAGKMLLDRDERRKATRAALPGSTRVLTTIVMELGLGICDRAMAYGIVLLMPVALVVGLLTWAQQSDRRR